MRHVSTEPVKPTVEQSLGPDDVVSIDSRIDVDERRFLIDFFGAAKLLAVAETGFEDEEWRVYGHLHNDDVVAALTRPDGEGSAVHEFVRTRDYPAALMYVTAQVAITQDKEWL